MNFPGEKGEFARRRLVDLERGEVSAEVLTDPAIYDLERERLWKKSWLFVGHESEIPNPGDYVSRYMCDDMVVVTRDRTQKINVVLNSCTHRGMAICRSDMGNTNSFVCPYHGWTFGVDGAFRGSPVAAQKMHGELHTKEELALKRARVGVHCGLIFATFDESIPPLMDFLGEAAWYLTLMFGRTKNGMEVLGPPQRWQIDGNWKLPAEQFVGGDTYHVYSLHRSMFELSVLGKATDINATSAPAAEGADVYFPQGHSFRCTPLNLGMFFGEERAAAMTVAEKLRAVPPASMTPDLIEHLLDTFDEKQLRMLTEIPPTVGGIFPNIATHSFPWLHPDGGILGAAHGLHAFIPKGHGKVEWWNWQFVEKDAPEELKARIAETCILATGPAGMLEADDGECWPAMQRVAAGAVAADGITGTIKYHALNGENRPEDWPGGGHVSIGFAKDDAQMAFWRRYSEMVEGDGR